MPKFEIPIQRLVQRRTADWVQFLIPDCQAEWIHPFHTKRTARLQSRMDEVFLVNDPEGAYIIHFEPQCYLDPSFPARMMRYRADIWEATMAEGQGTPHIHQTAVFFFPNHENSGHVLTDHGVNYTYHVLRLWLIPKKQVLDHELTGLYPLLPFMKEEPGETPEQLLYLAIETIREVKEPALRFDLLAVLGIICGEKYTPKLISQYIRREILMQSSIYQEWIQEDIKEAVTKAVREAETRTDAKATARTLKNAIMEILVERFDYIRKGTQDKINTLEDIELLSVLHKKSIKVGTLNEFEQFLDVTIS